MTRSAHVKMAVGTAAVLAIALSVASLRRSVDEAEAAKEVRRVVRSQLDAFNKDDYQAAYRFAAPEIQEQFPLPNFEQMVKEGYPQIARSRSAEFGTPEVRGSEALVPLTVTGEDGVAVRVTYLLRRERDGWRVAGVDGGMPIGPSPPGGRGPRPSPSDKPKGDRDAV